MYGIYKMENGLKFTGVITSTKEKAIEYIKTQCRTIVLPQFIGHDEETGTLLYEMVETTQVNWEAWKIEEVTVIL